MGVMTVTELDSSALRSTVAFTGRLACMTRAEAFEVVRAHGGTPGPTVTRQTNVLIVGELGWPLLDNGRPSNKLSRAGSYSIPVVSERRFLEWIGKAVPDTLNRAYSVGQITMLSKLSHGTVQELTRFGLLNPRGGLFGFRDLASARQVASLFANGIALSEIIRSVKEIRAWLPEADLSNLRLQPGPQYALEVEQAEGRTDFGLQAEALFGAANHRLRGADLRLANGARGLDVHNHPELHIDEIVIRVGEKGRSAHRPRPLGGRIRRRDELRRDLARGAKGSIIEGC